MTAVARLWRAGPPRHSGQARLGSLQGLLPGEEEPLKPDL